MLLGYFSPYKNVKGTIEYDYDDNIYYGEIKINSWKSKYRAMTADKLYDEFIESVDSYMD